MSLLVKYYTIWTTLIYKQLYVVDLLIATVFLFSWGGIG